MFLPSSLKNIQKKPDQNEECREKFPQNTGWPLMDGFISAKPK